MSHPDYRACGLPVRPEVEALHAKLLGRLTRAGTWWTGVERRAIAAAARAARDCELCRERKAALSPAAVQGRHDGPDELPAEVVDVIHRVVTDPGRLSKSWYEGVLEGGGLDDAHYVELIGVTVTLNALDVFARAVGVDSPRLPEAARGEPSRERPASARVLGAWVPQIPSRDEGGDDAGDEWRSLYGDMPFVPQIGRALSLVPAEVENLKDISEPHYMALENVADPRYQTPGRALDRLQMELVASRVSSLNDCFY